MKKLFLSLFTVGLLATSFVSCRDQTAAEEAGDNIEEAAEDTGDAIDDAADDVEDAVD
ncbi:hypothetical protein [Haloflavibacter putidus]|uniref:hypothetical protein n=1 Tax=Haloflavibacter putidus TaxID=2576776 RepID=UPI001F3EF3FC|nr:hypothetical protein [Haloflavibacter putidus]